MTVPPEPPSGRIAFQGLDILMLALVSVGYLAIVLSPYFDLFGDYAPINNNDRVVAAETQVIAFWTKVMAVGQIFGGIVTAIAAYFAFRAYQENSRARVAAERQAKVAEDQLKLAHKADRQAKFDAISERWEKDQASSLAMREKASERDERAAATRAVLVFYRLALTRVSASGVPHFTIETEVENVGGSVALDVAARLDLELSADGMDRLQVSGSRTSVRAVPVAGRESILATAVTTAIDFQEDYDLARDAINGPIDVSGTLTLEWSDVHGYRITESFGFAEYFEALVFKDEDVANVLRAAVVMQGEREVDRREP